MADGMIWGIIVVIMFSIGMMVGYDTRVHQEELHKFLEELRALRRH